MHVIADVCVVPIGVGVSVSKQVAECQRIIEHAGLNHHMHAYGTNVEGEWDQVMQVIKQCHERLHDMGVPRLSTTIKLGTRIDREQSMTDKVRSVETQLKHE